MHKAINDIYTAHNRWLKNGGDQSIPQVQQANLVMNVDEVLRRVERAAYELGYKDGRRGEKTADPDVVGAVGSVDGGSDGDGGGKGNPFDSGPAPTSGSDGGADNKDSTA